ncbi:MAG: hypothetical protein ABI625_24245, partial [bacterium]
VSEVPAKEGRALLVDRHDTHDLILFGAEGGASVGQMEVTASTAFVRRRSPAGEIEGMALFGGGAGLVAGPLEFRVTTGAEAVRGTNGWTITGDGQVSERS